MTKKTTRKPKRAITPARKTKRTSKKSSNNYKTLAGSAIGTLVGLSIGGIGIALMGTAVGIPAVGVAVALGAGGGIIGRLI